MGRLHNYYRLLMGWGVTPPYLDDVWSGIDEWPMRVSLLDLLIFFRSWHLVPLSEEAIGWLSMQLSQPLLLACSKKNWHLQHSVLMVKDRIPTFFGGFL
jgi:hypothetical protein